MSASDKLKQSYYDELSQEEEQENSRWADTIINEKETELILLSEEQIREVGIFVFQLNIEELHNCPIKTSF